MDEEIALLVRRDYISRKNMDWQTLTIDDIHEIQAKKVEFAKYPLVKRSLGGYMQLKLSQSVKNMTYFTEIDYLIKNYPVVAAGGAVYKSLYGMSQQTDIDIFFYGNYDGEQAEKHMINIMYYFENKYEYVIFERNQNITNILVGEDPEFKNDIKKYQFVHRVYPTKISIVGGFDLQCSSIYYDGTYGTTPLGAWCIAHNINIFLHTRRSASYEYRLIKYFENYGCEILLLNTTYAKLQINLAKANYSVTTNYRWKTFKYVPKLEFLIDTIYNNEKIELFRRQHLMQDKSVNVNDILDEEKSDYGAIRTGYHEKNNARFAATNRIDLITWSGPSVNSIIKPKLQYKIDKKIVKTNIKKKDIKTLADAAPLLNYIILYNKQNKQLQNNRIAEYWLQDKFDEICEQVFAYLTNNKQNEMRRAFNKPEIDSNTLLLKLYDNYKNTIVDKIANNMFEAQKKSQNVNWIVNNPMRQWTSSINRIITDPKTYFNSDYYTEFKITIDEEIETLLRLFMKHKCGPFRFINKNILNIIIQYYILIT